MATKITEIKIVGSEIGENVSDEMKDTAKNLRKLATLIESGLNVTAIATVVITREDEGLYVQQLTCIEDDTFMLIGALYAEATKISNRVNQDEP